ncbi:HABP4 protein, partial [Rhinopomastus cyanomelas]|nr:HABP4 protein [Rhinopomastus cyanomelas]
GQKQTPKLGEHQGFTNRGSEVKRDKTEWRPSYREFGSNGRRRQTEFKPERNEYMTRNLRFRLAENSDRGRSIRGRGRGRGGRINRGFDDSDWKGKREFQRQSVKDKIGKEQTAPKEETGDTAEQSRAPEGEPRKKVAEGETMEELVQEMTLDEWKNLQQQSRPKPEFNIRKTESTVPSKAVVIHKSKYRDDLQKEYLDDTPVIRRPVNDITSQLDINFGNLSRPGSGSRGARRGRGHGRHIETGPQPEVVILPVAPNPDDPEDFPAL